VPSRPRQYLSVVTDAGQGQDPVAVVVGTLRGKRGNQISDDWVGGSVGGCVPLVCLLSRGPSGHSHESCVYLLRRSWVFVRSERKSRESRSSRSSRSRSRERDRDRYMHDVVEWMRMWWRSRTCLYSLPRFICNYVYLCVFVCMYVCGLLRSTFAVCSQ
jgi:hypothetical protein